MTITTKEKEYKKILISICKERGLDDLAVFILGYEGRPDMAPIVPKQKYEESKGFKYNITKLPEAVCDGCEG